MNPVVALVIALYFFVAGAGLISVAAYFWP